MPVTTRSTTRKTRSLTMCAKPLAQAAAGTREMKQSFGKMYKKSSKRNIKSGLNAAAPKATTKSTNSAVEMIETDVASRNVERDQQAEKLRLEWEATVAKHPPCKTLTADDLPGPGKTVPRRLYGWPISEDYMLDYARRHRLIFPVISHYRDQFDGKNEINFGDLTDDHLADKHLSQNLHRSATVRVLLHFAHEVHARWMMVDCPISLEWKTMVVLWSTDDYEKKYTIYDRPGKWEKVKKFIDDALNECLPEGCERRTSLAWWYSYLNSVSP